MIGFVASCPHPPALLPGSTGTAIAEVERLRSACRAAVRDLLASGVARVVVIGGAERAAVYADPARTEASPGAGAARFAPWPGRAGATETLPLSVAVGVDLLGTPGRPVELHAVSTGATREECVAYGRRLAEEAEGAGSVGLLVMADGSARRGPKAPGYVDDRAAVLDEVVERALSGGDPAALLEIDAAEAAELLIAGRAAWQVLAGACAGARFRARRYYSDDPFGVWYPVYTWQPS